MDFLFLSIFNQKQLGNNIEPSIRASSHTNTHTPTIISGGNHKQPQLRVATHT